MERIHAAGLRSQRNRLPIRWWPGRMPTGQRAPSISVVFKGFWDVSPITSAVIDPG